MTNGGQRQKLSDILRGDTDRQKLADAWNSTEAAADFQPLPSGEYVAHIVSGECFKSRTNETPGYKIVFKVIEGEHADRRIWHELWLTEAAMPMAKRDLAKIGIESLDQLDEPLPADRIRCKVRVALRRDDDGTEYNRVRRFDVIGIDEPEIDPFAPKDEESPPTEPADSADTPVDPPNTPTDEADAADAGDEGGTAGTDTEKFGFGANVAKGGAE